MLKSVTETSTTLNAVDEAGVTLKVEVAVLVGGKRLDTDPQTLRQGFHGEVAGNEPVIRDLGRAELVVENRRVDCRVLELEFPRPGGRSSADVLDAVELHHQAGDGGLRRRPGLHQQDQCGGGLPRRLAEVPVFLRRRVKSSMRCVGPTQHGHRHHQGREESSVARRNRSTGGDWSCGATYSFSTTVSSHRKVAAACSALAEHAGPEVAGDSPILTGCFGLRSAAVASFTAGGETLFPGCRSCENSPRSSGNAMEGLAGA